MNLHQSASSSEEGMPLQQLRAALRAANRVGYQAQEAPSTDGNPRRRDLESGRLTSVINGALSSQAHTDERPNGSRRATCACGECCDCIILGLKIVAPICALAGAGVGIAVVIIDSQHKPAAGQSERRDVTMTTEAGVVSTPYTAPPMSIPGSMTARQSAYSSGHDLDLTVSETVSATSESGLLNRQGGESKEHAE